MLPKIKPFLREKKKVIISTTISMLAIIMLIIGVLLSTITEVKEEKKQIEYTGELARAMTYAQVVAGEEATDSAYVNFDAFFLRDLDGDGYAESVRGTCKEIGKQDTLYMELKVLTNGRLENGVITINSDNFNFETALPKDNEIKKNVIGNNIRTIELNTIKNGTQKLITGLVKSGNYSYGSSKTSAIGNDTSKYSKINSVTITGTHIADDGTETQINKTVNFNIDWYGETEAKIASYSLSQRIDFTSEMLDIENKEVNLEFDIDTIEMKNQLILSKSYIEGELPQVNGNNPTKVEITGENVTYTYDEETRKFTAQREAVIDENGVIKENAYTGMNYNEKYTKYTLKVTYPIEIYEDIGVYNFELKIPVSAYYEGYNNVNEEFTNPYKSNIAKDMVIVGYGRPVGTVAIFDVEVGKYVSTPRHRYMISKEKPLSIYNGIVDSTEDDTYLVRWTGYTGSDGQTGGIIMKETPNGQEQIADHFMKVDTTEDSMENLTSNVAIYFGNPKGLLGENGWIKVYNDETDELLETFTIENWSNYDASNPYKYEIPVKHIRVETSETNINSYLRVYNIKELDDEYITENYTKEQFNELVYIQSTLAGYIGDILVNIDGAVAHYEEPISILNLEINPTAVSTQGTERNVILKIATQVNEEYKEMEWQNGTFLVKMPEEIIDVEINNILVDNGKVEITNYEKFVENGNIFIKILTENESSAKYTLTINCNITPNPKAVTGTEYIEVYACNQNCENYYYSGKDVYDINGNSNLEEQVNKSSIGISLISPNSLLTSQVAKNYDTDGSEAIGPQIAYVEKEQRTAEIEVGITNNYSSTISEIQILGKIPTEGNTYTLSGDELGSNFTTTMSDAGIQIPESLTEYATVYYSEKENPTKDIEDTENGWLTTPTDWTKIKSYLINLNNYVMQKSETQNFTYEINIPEGLTYNQVAYSHHGVYFSLDTDEGKYRTNTEPNKLGVMIAKQYDLKVIKYQKDSNKLIPGATYRLIEENASAGKTSSTNDNGELLFKNIFAEKTYILKEIKSPARYELNEEEVKITTQVNENGELIPTLVSGTLRTDTAIISNKDENGDYQLELQVEDEVKADLKIVKTEEGTENRLAKVKYKVSGNDNSIIITTDENGIATMEGLSLGEEYTLEEKKAEGYYLASPIKFTITKNNGEYLVNLSEGIVKTHEIEKIDEIPTLTLEIENEKIPRYTLEINKVKKGEESEVIVGAKFELIRDEKVLGEYVTDTEGKIVISDLYLYEEGRNVDCTYTLKEVFAPEGYSKVKDIVFKVQEIDGILCFEEEIEEGQTAKNFTTDGTTVKVTIEDSPSFKLTKIDGTTQEILPGVKFAIYNIDLSEEPAKDSKGNIIGIKEVINGVEYYVVETNEKGEITANLPEGLYKAVEVEAPEKYDIENNVYYFGVGASRESSRAIGVVKEIEVGEINDIIKTEDEGYAVVGRNENYDGIIIKYNVSGEIEWMNVIEGDDWQNINSIDQTADGGYIVAGKFDSTSVNLGNGIIIQNYEKDDEYPEYDGIIIKYSAVGEVEWIETIAAEDTQYINNIVATQDGGFLIGGGFQSESITLKNGETLRKHEDDSYDDDGMIIKYNSNREIEWAQTVSSSDEDNINSIAELASGGYIITGMISGSTDMGVTINGDTDGIIINYNEDGETEWITTMGSENDNRYFKREATNIVLPTQDGGYIIGGNFDGNSGEIIDLGNVILEYDDDESDSDGMIIKFDSNNNAVWAKNLGSGIVVNDIAETSDNGYVLGIYCPDDSIFKDENTNTNIGTDQNGLVVKYDEDGIYQWTSTVESECTAIEEFKEETYIAAHGKKVSFLENTEVAKVTAKIAERIGGSNADAITTMSECTDGGIIAGGYFSDTIEVDDITLTTQNSKAGMIIKYNNKKESEWAKVIEVTEDIQIESIDESNNGGYIIGGYFSGTLIVENIEKQSNGSTDGFIIKYNESGEVEWLEIVGGSLEDIIESVVALQDGGYVAGGSFYSDIINLENGISVENHYSNQDGIILKYEESGKIKWAKSMGSAANDTVRSVSETKSGDILVGGSVENNNYFMSPTGTIMIDNIEVKIQGWEDGIILNYTTDGEIQWIENISKEDGGKYSYGDMVCAVEETSDGGYILIQVTGYYTDVYLTKLDSSRNIQWDKRITKTNTCPGYEDFKLAQTSTGKYIVGGKIDQYENEGNAEILYGNNTSIHSNGLEEGIVALYGNNGELEWMKGIGSTGDDLVTDVVVTTKGEYLVGGYFSATFQDEEVILENAGETDGFIMQVVGSVGVPEIQELTVENELKKFNITTDIEEIDGIKGGNISGEDSISYESVSYGSTSTKEIKMIPDAGYEIIKITVNGEEYNFTKAEDGSYTMPYFNNVIEDKHIVVTYNLTTNKITINKVSKDTQELLTGAKFKLDQIEERTEPVNVIGEKVDNGESYEVADFENEIEIQKELTINGEEYVIPDKTIDISQSVGTIIDNGDYYFIEENGVYVPTNSKTYQIENDGTAGIADSTAYSYIPIDLTNYTGEYTVVVNATASCEKNYDYGYATITEDTTATTSGYFMKIAGSVEAAEYPSQILEGGKIYYLHLAYYKDSYTDNYEDRIIINNINVYGASTIQYGFSEENGIYVPDNISTPNTTAYSYIPIDLTNYEGNYAVVVNAETESNKDADTSTTKLSAYITTNITRPTSGAFMELTWDNNAQNYITYIEGGSLYYLNLRYINDRNTIDKAIINSVNVYGTKNVTFGFINNNGVYESTNQGFDDTYTRSYIPIDLTNYTGKYNLTLNAKVSSEGYGDTAYAVVEETTDIPTSIYGFVYMYGEESGEYTEVLQGGKMYYLHIGYQKDSETSDGDDKFTINSIEVTLNDSDLYHTEVETNSSGQAITQIPFGKYSITETQAPEGYELLEEPVIIEFRANGEQEFTIENERKAKISVHHYIKGTTTQLADDELQEGKVGEKYTTSPHLDLEKYELEKDENDEYILPDNAVGLFSATDADVTYYYVEKQIPLTVHHYIQGTENKVPLKDGTEAEDVVDSGYEGDSYTTSAIENANLSDEYELVEVPENATGTYSGDEIIVTYYYKKIERQVTVIKYQQDGTTPLEGAKFEMNGNEYETNANGKISLTLEVGEYVLTEIEAPEGYQLPENPTTNITITRDTTAEEIQITNDKVKGTVTVHHYIENTTTPIQYKDGSLVETEYKTGYIGEMYATQQPENIDSQYELISEPENASGEFIDGNIEVIYYYKVCPKGNLTIEKQFVEGTVSDQNESLDEKEFTFILQLGTDESMNFFAGTYELVDADGNLSTKTTASGEIKLKAGEKAIVSEIDYETKYVLEEQSEYYYYVDSIDVYEYDSETSEYAISEDDTMSIYSVEGTIKTPDKKIVYTNGLANRITITGTKQWEGYSNERPDSITIWLDNGGDGIYTKTVTEEDNWQFTFENIYASDEYGISYSYTAWDMDVYLSNGDYYYNKQMGTEYNGYTVINTLTATTGINVKVKKEWVYETIAGAVPWYDPPESVTVGINGSYGNQTVELTPDNNWEYTFLDLPKYDYYGNYIDYTPYEECDLWYFETGTPQKIDDTTYQITNTYTGPYYPLVSQSKSYSTEYGKNYVEQGEKITYTINITNGIDNLWTEGDVIVKDTIPTGTTFVEGSIYINGIPYEYSQSDLENGISISMSNTDSATVGFQVEVSDGAYGEIRNIATVNDVETNEVVVPVKNKYRVEYYYDGIINNDNTDIFTAEYSPISYYDDKCIDGYRFEKDENCPLTITGYEDTNVIKVYYVKRTDLGYVVNYLDKDTGNTVSEQKVVYDQTFGDVILSANEVIEINGYDYDSVDKDSLTITTGDNIINIYYTKRSDLSYTVNYLEKNTNAVLNNPKVVENQTFGNIITSTDEVIVIDGYNYDSVDKAELIIGTGENVINIYYVKRSDISYTVNYLEKDTNNVLSTAKTVENQTFGNVIVSSTEVIGIDGYNYDSVDKAELTIGTEENVINIYYTKRNDLTYTVNYLEKDTNIEIKDSKLVENQVFGSVITSMDEVVYIDGYIYDSTEKENITITTGENIINIYYIKRSDLSYTVNYLEKDTEIILADAKVVEDKTFGETVTSLDEVILIDGYDFDSVDKEILTIGTGENIINIYYTRVTGLSYTVNYLEKDTNEVINPAKVESNQTFGNVIASSSEVIDIDGYIYDSVDKQNLTITTGENILNIYYIKRSDLNYTVNYLEKETNEIIYPAKTEQNQTFGDIIISTDEVIEIDGYNYDSVDKEQLEITTGENVINIYYTKRTDLSYTVNYLEKDTNEVLSSAKTESNQIFGAKIQSADEVIDIDGYTYDSVDKNELIITTGENVLNIYYVKRTDLSYIVNYLEKDTNIVLEEAKVVEGQTFESKIISANEIIDIDGYYYDSVDKAELIIGTGENVINIYYVKRNDLSYTVNYLEKDTNEVLKEAKVVENQIFGSTITALDEIVEIDGYNYDSTDKTELIIGTEENIINIYYIKRTDLTYTVNYLEKDTNEVLHAAKTEGNQTFKTVITSADEVIDIDGYTYDSVDKEQLEITTGENVINIYYVKRSDLSYTVNYLEKDTNKVLNNPKVVTGQTYKSVITSSNEIIDIDGYNYNSADKAELVIGTGENVINIYYVKRTDLSYKVNYLEKDTNEVLQEQKIVSNQMFESKIISANEVIEINGYNYHSVDKAELVITTGENVINIYYTKRTDLSYKVNYLEKNTNKELHEQKEVTGQTFEAVITSSNEVIEIDGYNYDSVDKEQLEITTGENVINIYYIKRADLSYKVNYLEKNTNKELHEQKEVTGQTFEAVITSSNEVIEIDGYNYDSVDKEQLEITTGENVINIYYVKRADLVYTVNYLEKDTNEILHPAKIAGNQIFESVINSSEEVIEINGYSYDSVDKDTLTIGLDENVINIYYTKVTGLSYTVNYLEKDTNEIIHPAKTESDQTFEDIIISADEVIDIDGYRYDSVDKDELIIGTEENVINIYYVKRSDLSYTVNYLEKDTEKVLNNPKVVTGQTFKSVIVSSTEIIEIDGYNYNSVDKEQLVISTGENVINIYYVKRNDLSYIVNYLEKDTNKELHSPKEVTGQTFEAVITTSNEVIDINGYDYNSVDKEQLVITTGENVINIYYTKRTDLSYTVNYLEKDTGTVLQEPKIVNNQIFENVINSSTEIIEIDGYNYDSVDKEQLVITTEENVINIYYVKRSDLGYTVNYLEKDTNIVLEEPKVVEGQIFETVITTSTEIIEIDGYNYDSSDKAELVIGTGENVINIYYVKRNDLSYRVNYLEKDTNKVLHSQKVVEGQTFGNEITATSEVITINGYSYDSADKEKLTITTNENVINLYYTKVNGLSYTVNYLEKDTNEVLHPAKTESNQTFENVILSANEIIDIDGYSYDSVDKDELTIGTEENVINIYYVKRTDLSYIVNYLEKDIGTVLHEVKTVENQEFNTVITSANEIIDIDGYVYDSVDKVELIIGTGENVINIYYTKRNDLTYRVNYLEKDTNTVLHNEKIVENQVLNTVVTSSSEIIDIDGYRYDSVDKETLTITTGENVINIYYVKRDDLMYTVNYLEKGTNTVLHSPKVVEGQTFETEITSSNEIIDIDGYRYDSVDKETLTITTEENVINIYYVKRDDLSYIVNYLEKDTNIVLEEPKVAEGQTFASVIVSSTEVIDIDGYNYDSVDKEQLEITTGENVINIYYVKRTDLSYKVNYLEKDTNKILHPQKVTENQTFASEIISSTEVIAINGYSYDSVDKEKLTIGIEENVINIYYTKVNGLSYTVNYLEKDTNEVIHPAKTESNQTFEDVIISSNEIIEIDGYNYDSVDKDELTIGTEENVINIYYVKRSDLSYIVNYLEKETNEELHEPKEVTGQTFENVITSSNEVIEIDGYSYDSVDKAELIITTGENVINIYYVKRTDLSYIVNYLEKETNKILHEPKEVTGQTFENVITSSNEVIEIDGYDYDSVDKDELTITTGENVINIYYVKRSDLSYIVNYLEKDTNIILEEQKVAEGQTFENVIISSNEVIEIDGYVYDSVDKEQLEITTGENVINIYYVKRTDLSYTVNYLEKETNEVLHDSKEVSGQTFENIITSSNEVIEIDGYNYDSVDKETLTITTGENVINIYYVKRGDLIYKVNYLEKETNAILHTQKVVTGQVLATIITAADEVIEIDGYNYDSVDKAELEITTGENIINIYYTRRTDLSYIVNYFEKGTDRVIHEQKNAQNQVLGAVINSNDEVINIEGYNFVEADKENLTIETDGNVINLYYERKDASVIVHYYEEGTTNKVSEDIEITGKVFDEYTTESSTNVPSKYELVGIPENSEGTMTEEPIEVIYYYRKKQTQVIVHHYEEGTANQLSADITIEGRVDDTYTTTEATDVPSKYELVEIPVNSEGIMTEEPIEVIYYYRKKQTQVIVHHYEEGTTNQLSADVTIEGRIDDTYTTTEATDVPNEYELVEIPVNSSGIMLEESIEVIYYYRKKPARVIIHYYEEGTTNKLSEDVIIEGKIDDTYTATEATDIPSKYELIEVPTNSSGIMTQEPIDVIYYYRKKKTQVIVHHYEEGTTNKLSENTIIKGRIDDNYTTTAATDVPIKYELVSVPENATGIMLEETVEVTYYYRLKQTHIIIKYLEKGTNKELAMQEQQEGRVDDEYSAEAKNIENYEFVEDSGNTEGTMTLEPITVIFWYVQKAKVTVQYVDKTTEEIIEQSTTEGLVGDEYTSHSKDFEDYVLIEIPENETVVMTENEIILKYYYIHVSGGVIEKHIDINTGDILANAAYEGNEGDSYNIPSKTFEGYDLVEDRLPTNSIGTMTREPIEVIYYYNYRSKVIAKYLDKETGEELIPEEVINGHEKEPYTTERKEFEGYKLVEVPENADGEMTKEVIEVVYYYMKVAGGVIERHLDISTGEELVAEERFDGYEGEEYKTEPENISGYDLVEEKYPENSEGIMTKEEIIVNYYYIKQVGVTIKYVDQLTGEEIIESEIISGHEGDTYTSEPKEIPGYILVEVPENKDGTMEREPIEVIYTYVKPAKVIVNHIDIDTNKLLAEEEIIEGLAGDAYTTTRKEFEYYTLIEMPANAQGNMTVEVVKDENGEAIVNNIIFVNYYYRKMEFNLKVDKRISSVIVNGVERYINSDFGKVEINRKEISTTNIQVVYSITVTNNGDIKGKGRIIENVPSGMIMRQEKNNEWDVSSTVAKLETKELEPGESVTYKVVLDWLGGDGNVGTKNNIAEITGTENEIGFEEKDISDNKDNAELVITIGTGEYTYAIGSGIVIILLAAIGVTLKIRTRKED